MDYYLLEECFIDIKDFFYIIIAAIAIIKYLEKGGKSNEYEYQWYVVLCRYYRVLFCSDNTLLPI